MKISIIVPVYNVEKYLEKCMETLLKQTYKELEIILVDDGSTDNSGKICDIYEEKDNRIKVFHKENGGLSSARNYGVKKSTGEYILFVDSDDFIDLTSCQKLADIIEDTGADIVCFNIKHINENNEEIKSKFYSSSNSGKITKMTAKEAILDNLFRKNIRYEAWSKIYKRKLVEEIKFPEGILAEDFATFYKYIEISKKIVHVDYVLYYYLHRDSGIMGTKSDKLYIDIYNIENSYYENIKKYCLEKKDLIKRESEHLKILFKTYTKLANSKENNYNEILKDINFDIRQINKDLLDFKMNVLFSIYKINKKLLTKIMKKYLQ